MRYVPFGNTGETVSALGFGVMRLPPPPDGSGRVDRGHAARVLETAYEQGITYYDAAENYLGGESEGILGDALHDVRDRVRFATKFGIWHVEAGTPGDVERLLEGQLRRLRTDRVDFYLIHAVTDARWPRFLAMDLPGTLFRLKREGFLRHVGFSFHGTPSLFRSVLDAYDWEFAQVQFNYVDRDMQAGESGLRLADARGLGTVVMEPLRGGQLVRGLPETAAAALRTAAPGRSPADWGLGWLWNRPDVDVVLSGMENAAQVLANCAAASRGGPGTMPPEELAAVDAVAGDVRGRYRVRCTYCRYCKRCPQRIDIPDMMQLYNDAHGFSRATAAAAYGHYPYKPDACVRCGACEEACPQNLPIMDIMEEVAAFFGQPGASDQEKEDDG